MLLLIPFQGLCYIRIKETCQSGINKFDIHRSWKIIIQIIALSQGNIHKYDRFSDEELLLSFQNNHDLDVLGILYKRYMFLVYGICMKYLKNRDDSQDAVMQIFEILIKDIPRFEIRNFKSWLYGVSRNYCLMQIRKGKNIREKLPEILHEEFMETTTNMHLVDEDDNETELPAILKNCMDQLKEEQRRCVELFYYQKWCYKEIANELNFDENKVKSYIQNGKRNLKICIESNSTMSNA